MVHSFEEAKNGGDLLSVSNMPKTLARKISSTYCQSKQSSCIENVLAFPPRGRVASDFCRSFEERARLVVMPKSDIEALESRGLHYKATVVFAWQKVLSTWQRSGAELELPVVNNNSRVLECPAMNMRVSSSADAAVQAIEEKLSSWDTPVQRLDWVGSSTLTFHPISRSDAYEGFVLLVQVQAEGLSLEAHGCPSCVDAAQAKAVLERIQMVLSYVAKDGDKDHHSISLVLPEERHIMLHSWLQTETSSFLLPQVEHGTTLHGIFEANVAHSPQRVAIVLGKRQVTYIELARQVNQVARTIARTCGGVTPRNTLVAVIMEKGIDMIAAFLGTVTAGAAFVPIAPDYPESRTLFMLRDSAPTLILVDLKYEKHVRSLVTANSLQTTDIVVVGRDTDAAEGSELTTAERPISDGEDLAYVMYTSGTTGQPKGVLIPHRAVVSLVYHTDYMKLSEEDVFLQLSNPCFDASTLEIWGALLLGGRLVIPSFSNALDAQALEAELNTHGVTVLWLTKTLFDSLFVQRPAMFSSLRYLLAGGEALNADLIKDLIASPHAPQHVINGYGPTESTTFTTAFDCKSRPFTGAVPLGRPIRSRQVLVVDSSLRLQPTGAPGELVIGGLGLAKGYLSRPELTAQRFVESTDLSEVSSTSTVYRSGDIVRWTTAPGAEKPAELEFLGRDDGQIKIRGFRVELGEVESAVSSISFVKQCAIIDYMDKRTNSKLLAAYVVLENGLEDTQAEDNAKVGEQLSSTEENLRRHLEQVLPVYAVPGAFAFVKSIPLNANGKLDRETLPDPRRRAIQESHSFQAPRDEIEKLVCDMVCQVLGLSQVGVKDHFFRIGGDSIISIQLLALLRKAGFNVRATDVVEAPTPELLADRLRANQKRHLHCNVETETGLLTGAFPMVPVQRWFLELKLADPNHFNQAFMVRLPGNVTEGALKNALVQLCTHHDMLRCTLYEGQQVFNESLGTILFDVLSEAEATAQVLTAMHAGLSMDGQNAPTWRAVWIKGRTLQDPSRLCFMCHHAFIDSVSWRILLSDIRRLISGESLPPKTSSFRQWAHALEAYASSPSRQEELTYWTRVITAGQEHAAKPLAPPHHQKIELDKALTEQLLYKANLGFNTEINDLLLSALAGALHHIFDRRTNHILLEGHGREDIDATLDVSRTVGWFTTLFPVELVSMSSVRETIIRTKEYMRRIPTKGLGYGALLQAKLGNAYLPTIAFNYLGQLDNDAEDSNWRISGWSDAALSQVAGDPCGCASAHTNQDNLVLNINGEVRNGQLQFDIYSQLEPQQTGAFARAFQEQLESVSSISCYAAQKGGFKTPADFDLVNSLDMEQLDRIQQDHPDLENICPASSLQQGFVHHLLAQPNDDAYRVQLLLEYTTCLNIERYKAAWKETVHRFPALRACFDWSGKTILQIICSSAEPKYSSFSSSEAPSLHKLKREDRLQPFDLSQPCPVRMTIVERDDSALVLLTMHHIVIDGWSLPLLLRAVHSSYDGSSPRPAEDKAFFHAQRFMLLQKNECDAFWSTQRSRLLEANDLSLLCGTSEVLTTQVRDPSEVVIQLDHAMYRRLKSNCAAHGVTFSVAVQFALHKLIHAYTNDVVTIVGTTVSGRDIPVQSIEESVALLINTLPLGVDWPEDACVLDVMNAIQVLAAQLDKYSAADLTDLQHAGARLFHILYVHQLCSEEAAPVQGSLASSARQLELVEKTDYPLTLLSYEHRDNAELRLKYDQAIMTPERADQVMTQIWRVLEWVAATEWDCTNHNDVQWLDKEERAVILGTWNSNTRQHHSPFATLTSQLKAQADKTPNDPAVKMGDLCISFAELENLSNNLAICLIEAHSVKRGDFVGLFVDTSVELVVAIMAILKVGAAYIPIATEYPEDRVRLILDDTQAKVVLTQAQYQDTLSTLSAADLVLIDDCCSHSRIASQAPFVDAASQDAIAYVIYTSGTTGRPKGVAVDHVGATSFSQSKSYVNEKVTVRNVASLSAHSFDGFIFDLFFAHANGACVHLVPRKTTLDPASLTRLLAERNIDTLFMTTALFNQLAKHDALQKTHLRQVLFGGEAANLATVQQAIRDHPDIHFIHVYGPTETIVYATQFHFSLAETGAPIGTPLENKRAYVLNARLHPVPVGMPGELYIGGSGLARGYHNREDLTAERFLVNPFADAQDIAKGWDKMYKTGDIVRWREDGNIEYLSRNDQQVKIRGFRIELGEIEVALDSLPAVQGSFVLAKQGEGSKFLVAYVVLKEGAEWNELSVREGLRRVVPEYFVPAVFVVVDRIPLNMNGKVDRRALPEPVFETPTDRYVAPNTDLEQRLCKLWAEVLPVDQVGIQDNFFGAGGNSISAIRLLGLIRRELGLEVPLGVFLEAQSVQALALRLGQQKGDKRESIPKVLQPDMGPDGAPRWPLSSSQERLLFLDRLEEGFSAMYHVPYLVKLSPEVDETRLVQALRAVVNHHDILRTVYRSDDGVAFQQLLHRPLQVGKEVCTARLRQVAAARIAEPFNLGTELPMRARLLVDGEDTFLLLVWHHVAFDGWSLPVFLSHLQLAFEGRDLPPLSIQYSDYATWQRRSLESERMAELLEFWRSHLDGFEPLGLLTDRPRPLCLDYKGHDIHFSLEPSLSNKLRAIAREQETTLFVVLLTALYATLAHQTGQADIVVGTPSENREYEQVQELVGFFVSSLPLRSTVDMNETFLSLLKRVRETVTLAKKHQELPFEKLVDALGVERDTSRHPVFQVMFGVQSFDQSVNAPSFFASRNIAWDDNLHSAAKFDLSLFLDDGEEAITGVVNYATSLYEEGTMKRFSECFAMLLESAAKDLQRPLRVLDVMSPNHRDMVLRQWNASQLPFSAESIVPTWFDRVVSQYPRRQALFFDGEALTYTELKVRANRIAHVLQSRERFTTGSIVALFLDKGFDMVAAILGVLKAGGAYVPIAPEYPSDRIAFILKDTSAPIVLCHEHYTSTLSGVVSQGVEVICADARSDEIQCAPTTTPKCYARPEDLAYVIYTSGTTGKPKGVMITHRNIAHMVVSVSALFEAHLYQRALLFATYVFDASVVEIFVSLFEGHTLYIATEEQRREIHALSELVLSHQIELATIPPALLQCMEPSQLASLRHLVVAGEAPSLNVLKRFSSQGRKVMNGYGPTENTVCVSGHVFQEGESNTNIGRPIANVQAYVIGQTSGQPVPIGAPGELFISGDGLSRGYLNRPELTSERFVDNPFRPGSKMYKTGDIVRWLPSGELEFLGRSDNQVKVRGFRIELGEIENAINALENVQQAVVVPIRNGKTVVSLAAYFVGGVSEEELSGSLAAKLPEYLIPSVFVSVPSIPRTINGKVDFRALPSPTQKRERSCASHCPSTRLEKQLCDAWKAVLGLEIVDMQDNFFRIGGDSIVSIQLVSRLRREGLSILVKDIFEAPTVAKLARLLLARKNASAGGVQTKTEQGLLTGAFPLLPIQQKFFSMQLRKPNHWNQAFMVRIPGGTYTLADVRKAIRALAEQHDVMRLCIGPCENLQRYEAEVNAGAVMSLDISTMQKDVVQNVLTALQAGFNVYDGPMWSAAHVTGFADGNDRVWFAFHHLIIDTVSWRILAEDLHFVMTGQPLPKKTTSYRQWVEAVQLYANVNASQAEYWKQVLEGQSSIPNLGETVENTQVSLLKSDTKALVQEANKGYFTEINDVLLAALALALHQILDSDVYHITLESTGRERGVDEAIDLSRTVGWFTSAYPVRLETRATVEDTIIHTKEMLRRLPEKGIGFGALKAAGLLPGAELPGIEFNYLGQFGNKSSNDGEGAALWAITEDESGCMIPPENFEKQSAILSINGGIMEGGQLRFHICSRLGVDRTRRFSEAFESCLVEVISTCKATAQLGGLHTPCDFGLEGLSMGILRQVQEKWEIEAIFPATSLQLGFVHHSLANDVDLYNVQMSMIYDAPFEHLAFSNAWSLTVAKFPALRTCFDWTSGSVIQIVVRHLQPNIEIYDFTDLDAHEQQARITKLQDEQHATRFQLNHPGLLRVTAVQTSPSQFVVIKTMHHSIFDGWSEGLLMEAVHQTYDEIVRTRVVPSGPKDTDEAYIEAQTWLSKSKSSAAAFWKEQRLGDANDVRVLESSMMVSAPTGTADLSTNQDPRTIEIELASPACAMIRALCNSEAVTPTSVLLLAWHHLLHEFTGASQTIVGTVVSGREIPVDGVEKSVGLYINTLPHSVEWDTELDPSQRLQEVHRRLGLLNQHSNISLSELQTNGERLFHSLFLFENFPLGHVSSGIASKAKFLDAKDATDYPICLSASELSDGMISLKLAFDGAWMKETTARSLLQNLERFLEKSSREPLPLQPLPLERGMAWTGETVHEVFENVARSIPEAVAIHTSTGEKLTYREVNTRATALAHVLGPLATDDLVALYFDRSPEMLVAQLAVLKAGGAYVPIAPDYPTERVQFILEDTEASVMVTQDKYFGRLAIWAPNVRLVNASHESTSEDKFAATENPPRAGPRDLAYIIYTSGTTGKPKGVMIEHHSVLVYANAVRAVWERIKVQRIDFSSNYTFDLSVTTSVCPLLVGATVCLYTGSISDITEYQTHLDALQVDFVSLTPRLAEIMLHGNAITTVRACFLGGEKITPECLDRISASVKFVFDEYGPTEATVACSIAQIRPTLQRGIGKPYPLYDALVLDRHLRPVPVGALGELCIGGAALARGYLKRPDLTADKFVEIQKGRRVYRTGDVVRMLDTGDIEYVGRNDTQVKIRGYRVELGEVEAALNALPEVARCAVVDSKNAQGDPFLVAYVVSDGRILSFPLLQEALSKTLPSYMVPSAFVELEEIPVTLAGKLDRRALPEVDNSEQRVFSAPNTPLEGKLCAIWQEILGVEQVGINDSFFQLGGNSIAAIRLIARVKEELGLRLTLDALYQGKTVGVVAATLEGVDMGLQDQPIVFKKTDFESAPLSFSQQQMLFLSRFGAEGSAYHIPLLFQLGTDIDLTALYSAFQYVTDRHKVLNTVYRTDENGDDYQQVRDEPVEPEPVAVCYDWRVVLRNLLNRPFELSVDPPMRFEVIEDQQRRLKLLAIVFHHIAFDGWSTEIFIDDLVDAYEAFKREEVPPLATLEAQYSNYARWQREERLCGRYLDSLVSFWKTNLEGFENLALPTDRPRRSGPRDTKGKSVSFELDEDLSRRLRSVACTEGTTLFTVLLSAYYVTLALLSGQSDLVIGTPSENRDLEVTQSMVGFFVNLVALRTQVDFGKSARAFVAQVHAAVLQAKKHQELPFERVVDALQVERNRGFQPIVQALFSVHSFECAERLACKDETLPFAPCPEELAAEITQIYSPAKHDLSLTLDDGEMALRGTLVYATALFDQASMERLVSLFQRVLSFFAGELGKPLGHFQPLSAEDRSLVLGTWNSTRLGSFAEQLRPLHVFFEDNLAKYANETALVYLGQEMSYGQLNEHSNQLARAILAARSRSGKTTGPFVVLFLDRGIEMVVSMLAVLKAGLAYVPIATNTPADRIKYICDDTQAHVVVTQYQHSSALFPGMARVEVDDCAAMESFDRSNLGLSVALDDLAYVIYTSGTTGKPKGVMIEHQQAANFVLAQLQNMDTHMHKRALQFASYQFDASVFDIWLNMMAGNTLYVASEEQRLDAAALSALVQGNHITWAHFPPSRLLGLDLSMLSSLRFVALGGEAPTKDMVEGLLSQGCKVVNSYGPTETTVTTSVHDYKSGDSPCVIGKPIANTVFYVLDPATLQLVPPGSPGELFVGGCGVARGYLNRPELTAERFIANPFMAHDGYSRLYRTGDTVRWLHSSGEMEYIGRKDSQVKIKGYRIELGEIQWTLGQLPSVQACVVVPRKSRATTSLIAYVVPAPGFSVDADILSAALKDQLPDYMVPQAFVSLERIPLTVNGKLDINELPAPSAARVSKLVEPRNEKECLIAQVWKRILGVEELSVHDDFFRIGGDSILSTHLVSQLRRAGFVVSISDVFEHTSIAKQARALSDAPTTPPTVVPTTLLKRSSSSRRLGRCGSMRRMVRRTSSRLNATSAARQRLLRKFISSVATKNYCYLIHPSGAGVEVYGDLVKHLNRDFNCKGIENYNFVMEKKSGDLKAVAETYLDLILDSKKGDADSPFVLVGWSLGGKIALEVAGLLESRGITNVYAFLLDTFIIDPKQEEESKKEASEETIRKMMVEVGFAEDHVGQVLEAVSFESQIAETQLSSRLEHTRVEVFKSMQVTDTFDQETHRMWERRVSISDNGIGSVAEQVTVHQLPEHHHYNLLKAAAHIADVINCSVHCNQK